MRQFVTIVLAIQYLKEEYYKIAKCIESTLLTLGSSVFILVKHLIEIWRVINEFLFQIFICCCYIFILLKKDAIVSSFSYILCAIFCSFFTIICGAERKLRFLINFNFEHGPSFVFTSCIPFSTPPESIITTKFESLFQLPISHHSTKNGSFQLKISSVNVTNSAGSYGFGHIYWRNPQWKTSFFLHCIDR